MNDDEELSAPVEVPGPVIPLADLRRLDLKPGDRLAVIGPADIRTVEQHQFERVLHHYLAAFSPDITALVFPHGTELAVISAEQIVEAMERAAPEPLSEVPITRTMTDEESMQFAEDLAAALSRGEGPPRR